jgi:hypothetical protein
VCTGGRANVTPFSVCGAAVKAPMSNWMSDGWVEVVVAAFARLGTVASAPDS